MPARRAGGKLANDFSRAARPGNPGQNTIGSNRPRSPNSGTGGPRPADRVGQILRFSNRMLSPSPRISLVKTSKLAGVPASKEFSPLTIDS